MSKGTPIKKAVHDPLPDLSPDLGQSVLRLPPAMPDGKGPGAHCTSAAIPFARQLPPEGSPWGGAGKKMYRMPQLAVFLARCLG